MKTNNKTAIAIQTKNYDMFEMHGHNRPIHRNDMVEQSMRRVGFMKSSPIQCIKNPNGKLQIIRGHHRFAIAKKLDIPLYYMIDDSNTDLFELEGSSTGAWNSNDFVYARAQAGSKDAQFLIDFKIKHGLTLGAAASLVFGQSAGSGNALKVIKSGKFKIGDMNHANQVVKITDTLHENGIVFCRTSAFVSAISACLRVPELDYNLLMHRCKLYSHVLSKRGTTKEYLDEIQALYNYNSKTKALPLAFRAKEIGKERAVANL